MWKVLKSDDFVYEATRNPINKKRMYGTSSLCKYVSYTHSKTYIDIEIETKTQTRTHNTYKHTESMKLNERINKLNSPKWNWTPKQAPQAYCVNLNARTSKFNARNLKSYVRSRLRMHVNELFCPKNKSNADNKNWNTHNWNNFAD